MKPVVRLTFFEEENCIDKGQPERDDGIEGSKTSCQMRERYIVILLIEHQREKRGSFGLCPS